MLDLGRFSRGVRNQRGLLCFFKGPFLASAGAAICICLGCCGLESVLLLHQPALHSVLHSWEPWVSALSLSFDLSCRICLSAVYLIPCTWRLVCVVVATIFPVFACGCWVPMDATMQCGDVFSCVVNAYSCVLFWADTLLHGYPFLGGFCLSSSLGRFGYATVLRMMRGYWLSSVSQWWDFLAPIPTCSSSWAVPRAGIGVCYCKPGFV